MVAVADARALRDMIVGHERAEALRARAPGSARASSAAGYGMMPCALASHVG